ncbi:TetR/AcrR family transcriptional regulator [Zavarzinia aquatilis]|nr:TetR/AcrR family transcriptional regulator [Zavarzinia aquatilis]
MSKGDDTRARIIRQAAALMNVDGYVATPVSAILAAAGLQKGGLYNHFASRDEVAMAAYDHATELALRFMLDIERGPGRAVERLFRLIAAYRDYGRHFPLRGGCPLLKGAVEGANGPEWLRTRARQSLDRMAEIIARLLAAGQAEGGVRPEIAPDRAALAIVATLEGAVMLTMVQRARLPGEAALEMIEAYMKSALLA